MTKSHAFRPSSTLELEPRLVLSTASPSQILAVEVEQQAIVTFAQGYQSAVQTILLAPSTTPTTQRTAFDTQVATLLGTLQSSLIEAVSLLPNHTTLDTDIDALITGNGSTSLESELDAIPTPSSGTTLSVAVFEGQALIDLAVTDANLTSDALGYGLITS